MTFKVPPRNGSTAWIFKKPLGVDFPEDFSGHSQRCRKKNGPNGHPSFALAKWDLVEKC